jgi:hypothetical protein
MKENTYIFQAQNDDNKAENYSCKWQYTVSITYLTNFFNIHHY